MTQNVIQLDISPTSELERFEQQIKTNSTESDLLITLGRMNRHARLRGRDISSDYAQYLLLRGALLGKLGRLRASSHSALEDALDHLAECGDLLEAIYLTDDHLDRENHMRLERQCAEEMAVVVAELNKRCVKVSHMPNLELLPHDRQRQFAGAMYRRDSLTSNF